MRKICTVRTFGDSRAYGRGVGVETFDLFRPMKEKISFSYNLV